MIHFRRKHQAGKIAHCLERYRETRATMPSIYSRHHSAARRPVIFATGSGASAMKQSHQRQNDVGSYGYSERRSEASQTGSRDSSISSTVSGMTRTLTRSQDLDLSWTPAAQWSFDEDHRDQEEPSHFHNPPQRVPVSTREASDDWGYFVDCDIPRFGEPTPLAHKQGTSTIPKISEQEETILEF